MNLYIETLDVLVKHGKSPNEVVAVSDGEKFCYWPQFTHQARNIAYDAGYGLPFINTKLVIIGPDWWLERHEYDGSEWWEFKQRPLIAGMSRSDSLKLIEEYYNWADEDAE